MTEDPTIVRRRRSSSGGGSGSGRSRSSKSRSGGSRSRSSKSRSGGSRSRRPAKFNKPWLYVGLGLIASGLAVLSWVGWEFWGTNWVSHHRQDEISAKVAKGWGNGEDTVSTKFGKATAILHVPRWGDKYAVPILEGDSESILAAGIAHFPHTAAVGKDGNYALAAHRVTHGEPFAKFPELRAGDQVYVETRTATYDYQLDTGGTDLVVPMQDTWVIDSSPVNPAGGVEPAPGFDKLITLVTCSEIFHTDNRSVVFGHLVRVLKKDSGAPVTPPPAHHGGFPWLWVVLGGLAVAFVTWVIRRRLR
ncbi:class E sortase [Nocardioides montaniterrae]